MNPIYIPSRHRPECQTARFLRSEGIESFKIVVEPHDWKAYRRLWKASRLVTLPEDHRGIEFSREHMKLESIDNGESHHWQMDDDISKFLHRPLGRKSHKIDAREAIAEVERLMNRHVNIGMAGFNQNSWPPKAELIFNDLPDQAFLINNAIAAKCKHDFKLPLLGNFDFALQMLSKGYCTAMFDHLRVVSPNIGSKPGGLKEVYENGHMKTSVLRLLKKWPEMKAKFHPDGKITLYRKKFMRRFDNRPVLKGSAS